jgi:hypothetical protein
MRGAWVVLRDWGRAGFEGAPKAVPSFGSPRAFFRSVSCEFEQEGQGFVRLLFEKGIPLNTSAKTCPALLNGPLDFLSVEAYVNILHRFSTITAHACQQKSLVYAPQGTRSTKIAGPVSCGSWPSLRKGKIQ